MIDVPAGVELAVELVKAHEGYKGKPYRDTGGWAFGYGTNFAALSDKEAQILADVAVALRLTRLKRTLHRYEWFNKADYVRQQVLLDMSYNLGVEGLKGFTRMIKALRDRDYITAAIEMLDSKWARQVGKNRGQRAWKLAKRMEIGR